MAGDYLLSVSGLPTEAPDSVFATGDLSKPGTGRPISSTVALAHTRKHVRSLGPVFNATKPSFHSDFSGPPRLVDQTQGIVVLPSKAESGSAGVQPDEE
jgi:hypothetical protein